jgi:NADPH:quinone reductase-like Zn-dependent oxidoreductase
MRAFAIDRLGDSGGIRDVDEPSPDAGEVSIRVAAAGLNPFDVAVLRGYMDGRMEHRFPLVPGSDAAGTIEAVGDDVDGWGPGDEVFGTVGKMYLGGGTLAEVATMSTRTIAKRPDAVDADTAAAIPVAGGTALTMADALAIAKGDVVVVIGATGGVGSYFVPIATARGAHIVAVARGRNADYARERGAAEVVDYTAVDVVEELGSRYADGIAAVADMHGDGELVARIAEHVREGGRVASAVGAANVEVLAPRGIEATNVMGMVDSDSIATVAAMLEGREIPAPELHRFSLDETARAIDEVASGHVRGKVVVVP